MTFEHDGKPVTEAKLAPPFQTTVMIRKAKAGTYTVKAVSSRNNGKAPDQNCETTFDLVKTEGLNFFFEGDFGKERRLREADPEVNPLADEGQEFGVCAALLGLKFGVDIPVGDAGWRVAPGAGVAINFDDGGNTSAFAEVELNKWFDRKGFIGTGLGVWDFTHGDTVAPTWLFQGGRQLWKGTGAREDEVLFVVSARLFLDELGDISNNYQFWGGFRYIFR